MYFVSGKLMTFKMNFQQDKIVSTLHSLIWKHSPISDPCERGVYFSRIIVSIKYRENWLLPGEISLN